MREILFRGKRVDNKEFIEGSYINSVVKGCPFGYITPSYPNTPTQVYTVTVGQYTGLTDKNGKKIFEGDIVKHCIKTYEPDYFYIGLIQWNEKEFAFENYNIEEGYSYLLSNKCVYEIIGNIHDNPDLLEDKEDEAK